jgi:hypothetical protein
MYRNRNAIGLQLEKYFPHAEPRTDHLQEEVNLVELGRTASRDVREVFFYFYNPFLAVPVEFDQIHLFLQVIFSDRGAEAIVCAIDHLGAYCWKRL